MSMLPFKKSKHTVRATAVLTASYVAGTVVSLDEQNYAGILVKYTKGDETNLTIKVETSVDAGTTYGQQSADGSPSSGVIDINPASRTFTATGNYWIPISPIKADTLKLSVLAVGGTPTGTVGLDVVTGWV